MAEEAFRQELVRLRVQNEQPQAAFIQLEQRQQQPQADVAASQSLSRSRASRCGGRAGASCREEDLD
eukprot:3212044-Amphidinium_carterae.1